MVAARKIPEEVDLVALDQINKLFVHGSLAIEAERGRPEEALGLMPRRGL